MVHCVAEEKKRLFDNILLPLRDNITLTSFHCALKHSPWIFTLKQSADTYKIIGFIPVTNPLYSTVIQSILKQIELMDHHTFYFTSVWHIYIILLNWHRCLQFNVQWHTTHIFEAPTKDCDGAPPSSSDGMYENVLCTCCNILLSLYPPFR